MLKLKAFYQYRREVLKNNFTFKKHLNSVFFKQSKKKLKPYFWKASAVVKPTAQGILYLKSSSSNTIITLSNLQGKVVCTQSCGCLGFLGKKKRTTKFAIQSTIYAVLSKIHQLGWSSIIIKLSGFGKGRSLLLKSLKSSGIRLLLLKDVTPLAHNGCRQKKLRRG